MDDCARQNPAYRTATERPRNCGASPLSHRVRSPGPAGSARVAPGMSVRAPGRMAGTLVLIVAALVIAASTAAAKPNKPGKPDKPAPPAAQLDRYSIVNGCFGLRSEALGRFVAKAQGTYSASAGGVGEAEPFDLQATTLGRYLFYGPARDFLARQGAATEAAGEPSDASDWTVDGSAGSFTITIQAGRQLSRRRRRRARHRRRRQRRRQRRLRLPPRLRAAPSTPRSRSTPPARRPRARRSTARSRACSRATCTAWPTSSSAGARTAGARGTSTALPSRCATASTTRRAAAAARCSRTRSTATRRAATTPSAGPASRAGPTRSRSPTSSRITSGSSGRGAAACAST